MNQTYALIRSRTFWTLVFMSLVPVVNAVEPTLSPAVQGILELILGAAGAYFHNSTAQRAGAVN